VLVGVTRVFMENKSNCYGILWHNIDIFNTIASSMLHESYVATILDYAEMFLHFDHLSVAECG
jgi:hypothetical protein